MEVRRTVPIGGSFISVIRQESGMLDIEKLTSKARGVLMTISVLGVVVAVVGTALTITLVSRVAQTPGKDWVAGLEQANGTLVLAGIGVLIAAMPFGILQ